MWQASFLVVQLDEMRAIGIWAESCSLEQYRSGLPEEGVLFSVHPRLQLQCRILPKRGHDEAEEQSDQHKHSRQDNLKAQTSVRQGKFLQSEKYNEEKKK